MLISLYDNLTKMVDSAKSPENRDKTHDTDISTMVHHVLLNCELDPMKLVSLFALRYIKKDKFSTIKKIVLHALINLINLMAKQGLKNVFISAQWKGYIIVIISKPVKL